MLSFFVIGKTENFFYVITNIGLLILSLYWLFNKNTADITLRTGETVDLPHCWNAVDGQDGGNDYHRGTCHYLKTFEKGDSV